MEDSIFVAKYASELDIVHRRDHFRASEIMLDRARQADNIDFKTPFTVDEFVAGEDGALGSVRLRNAETDEVEEIEAGGAFVAIGHTPQSALVADALELDAAGYVEVEEPSTRTRLAGVFAAGDLVDHTYRQAVTAAGSGCKAAIDAEHYLRDTPPSEEELAAAVEPATSIAE